jgi:hypothetical protein
MGEIHITGTSAYAYIFGLERELSPMGMINIYNTD